MLKIFNETSFISAFRNDLKRLLKRFKTLEEDMETFIESQLNLYHKLEIDNKGTFQLTDLQCEAPKIYKAKKFACRSLKGKGVQSGIRVIYAYFEKLGKIEFIEIYYKGDKENEDRQRIQKYLHGCISDKNGAPGVEFPLGRDLHPLGRDLQPLESTRPSAPL